MLAPVKAITDIVQSISKGIDSIVKFFADLWDNLLDFIKRIFVPSDSYWDDKVGGLQSKLEDKLGTGGYKQIMDSLNNATSGTPPNLKMTVFGVTFVIFDIAFLHNNLGYVHAFIYAIFAVLLLRYHINNVHKIISGNDLYSGGTDI